LQLLFRGIKASLSFCPLFFTCKPSPMQRPFCLIWYPKTLSMHWNVLISSACFCQCHLPYEVVFLPLFPPFFFPGAQGSRFLCRLLCYSPFHASATSWVARSPGKYLSINPFLSPLSNPFSLTKPHFFSWFSPLTQDYSSKTSFIVLKAEDATGASSPTFFFLVFPSLCFLRTPPFSFSLFSLCGSL